MPRLRSWKQRLIVDIVRDRGDPDALEVIRQYHQHSGEPLEPANIVRILQDLVREGVLRAERRPAPDDAPFEEMVHFMAIEDPAGDSPEAGDRRRPPASPAQLLEIVRFALRESPEMELARRVAERSEPA